MKFFFSLITAFSFIQSLAQISGDSIIIFVGKKIEVTDANFPTNSTGDSILVDGKWRLAPKRVINYGRYLCKYQILEKHGGYYDKDTITFIAFDHYGTPIFSKYDFVILYVYPRSDNGFVHCLYIFDALYKTTDGQWAGFYFPNSNPHDVKSSDSIHLFKKFENDVPVKFLYWKKKKNKELYPKPFYRHRGRSVFAVYGISVSELIENQKEGVLKARGHFD